MEENRVGVYSTLGARNYAKEERETNDYYATDPKALELLLDKESFAPLVWECACGEGHLSKILEKRGYSVVSTDLFDRGYGKGEVDFLKWEGEFDGDIITNPPYKLALEFTKHAIEIVKDGHKVMMFLRIQFLEGKERRKFFEKYPPYLIYVSSSRLTCAKNGDFEGHRSSNAVCFAWFIWKKGFTGEPRIRWFN